jgi:hypothetical protein
MASFAQLPLGGDGGRVSAGCYIRGDSDLVCLGISLTKIPMDRAHDLQPGRTDSTRLTVTYPSQFHCRLSGYAAIERLPLGARTEVRPRLDCGRRRGGRVGG